MMHDRKRIGEILVDLGVLTTEQVDRILDTARRRLGGPKKFGQLARDMGLTEEEEILAAIAVQMRLLPNIENMTLDEVLEGLLSATGAES